MNKPTNRIIKCAEVLYLCDPSKNTGCQKTICQKSCFATKKVQYAKLTEDGDPVEVVVAPMPPESENLARENFELELERQDLEKRLFFMKALLSVIALAVAVAVLIVKIKMMQ